MAYRFTNTDKWCDAWYSELKPMQKLLFNYLCDNCDIAGFIEVNYRRWASDIGTDIKTIEGALKGLQRGFKTSLTGDCIFIRNYIKHQKNWPLDPDRNPAHRGICKRFDLYSSKFNYETIDAFFEAPLEGLGRGLGNSNGNGSEKKLTIEQREEEFKLEVESFTDKYPIELLTSFFVHWSEYNSSKTKMKKEMQKTWDTAKRLVTWKSNDEKWKRK